MKYDCPLVESSHASSKRPSDLTLQNLHVARTNVRVISRRSVRFGFCHLKRGAPEGAAGTREVFELWFGPAEAYNSERQSLSSLLVPFGNQRDDERCSSGNYSQSL